MDIVGDDVIKCQVPKAEGGMTRYQGHVTIVPVCLYAFNENLPLQEPLRTTQNRNTEY
jgi:hypothetical protein